MFATQNYDFGTITTTVPNAARNAFNGAYEKFQDHFGKREPRPAGYFEPLGDFAGDDEI
jgi:sortilin